MCALEWKLMGCVWTYYVSAIFNLFKTWSWQYIDVAVIKSIVVVWSSLHWMTAAMTKKCTNHAIETTKGGDDELGFPWEPAIRKRFHHPHDLLLETTYDGFLLPKKYNLRRAFGIAGGARGLTLLHGVVTILLRFLVDTAVTLTYFWQLTLKLETISAPPCFRSHLLRPCAS